MINKLVINYLSPSYNEEVFEIDFTRQRSTKKTINSMFSEAPDIDVIFYKKIYPIFGGSVSGKSTIIKTVSNFFEYLKGNEKVGLKNILPEGCEIKSIDYEWTKHGIVYSLYAFIDNNEIIKETLHKRFVRHYVKSFFKPTENLTKLVYSRYKVADNAYEYRLTKHTSLDSDNLSDKNRIRNLRLNTRNNQLFLIAMASELKEAGHSEYTASKEVVNITKNIPSSFAFKLRDLVSQLMMDDDVTNEKLFIDNLIHAYNFIIMDNNKYNVVKQYSPDRITSLYVDKQNVLMAKLSNGESLSFNKLSDSSKRILYILANILFAKHEILLNNLNFYLFFKTTMFDKLIIIDDIDSELSNIEFSNLLNWIQANTEKLQFLVTCKNESVLNKYPRDGVLCDYSTLGYLPYNKYKFIKKIGVLK